MIVEDRTTTDSAFPSEGDNALGCAHIEVGKMANWYQLKDVVIVHRATDGKEFSATWAIVCDRCLQTGSLYDKLMQLFVLKSDIFPAKGTA